MKGCLAVIGGIVVVLFIIGACAAGLKSPSNSSSSDSTSNTPSQSAQTNNDCQSAIDHSNQAMKDSDAGDYNGGYKNANTAVNLADSCPEPEMYEAKGFALSARAFNEHHLSVGDAATDLNQANQLLEECTTAPSFYGTHTGANCETQMHNNISTSTNWEMNQ